MDLFRKLKTISLAFPKPVCKLAVSPREGNARTPTMLATRPGEKGQEEG